MSKRAFVKLQGAGQRHWAGQAARIAGSGVVVALMVWLRLVALDADAWPRLSWSSALLTDEGFYIHNARNAVLFGQARTDQFNNALIMPALHLIQLGVFRLFGVGAIQARLISVVFSLLTLLALYALLRRVVSESVAALAVVFLGLDHVNLLYNRMALMDTPGAFFLVCALYAFVRAVQTVGVSPKYGKSAGPFRARWLFGCGALFGLAYATRGLALLVVPAALFALWRLPRETFGKPEPSASDVLEPTVSEPASSKTLAVKESKESIARARTNSGATDNADGPETENANRRAGRAPSPGNWGAAG